MPVLRCRLLNPRSPTTVQWIEDARVELDDAGRIAAVGAWMGGDCDEDLRPGVLTPGFVDGHVHFPQLRIVGAASGPLLTWLERSTFPEEGRMADPAHAAHVARAFVACLAAAGSTTALVYSSVHPAACDALLSAVDTRGLRAIAGPVLMDQGAPADLLLPADRALPALDALVDRWHGHDDRIQVAVLPRFALSCSADLMARAAALARRHGLWVSTHLSENPAEVAATTALHGAADYLAVYEQAGLVHDRSVFAHCIHLSASEWDRLAAAGAVVAHCPDSNDFLGSGGMPLDDVDGRGIGVTLGTDIAAGRSFRLPCIAASAHDNALRQGLRQPPQRWLWQATRGGALALGLPDLGAVDAGLQADLVLHDLPPWVDDADSALAWLLFHHDAPPPRRTWVRGRVVWDRDQHVAAGGLWPWDRPADDKEHRP